MKASGRRLASTLTAIALLAGFSGTASASYIGSSWSHVYGPGPGLLVSPSRSYAHGIGDGTHGFRPGTDISTMTVSSVYGKFLSGSWRLDSRGYRQVPEPGTLALLAIGLIGIGMGVALSRRRGQK